MMKTNPDYPRELLRLRDLLKVVPVSRSVIYDMMKAGEFPKPVKVGPRAVAWRMSDVRDWIDSRPAA